MKREKIVFPFVTLAICLLFLPLTSYGEATSAAEASPDEALVIEAEELPGTRGPFMSKWLHMLDKQENGDVDNISVMAYGPQVPGDLALVLTMADEDEKTAGLFGVLFRTIVAIGLGFLAVFIFNRFARKGCLRSNI